VEREALEPGEHMGEAWGRDKILERQVRQICLVAALTQLIQNRGGEQTAGRWEN
jgi:hypothetical protein